MIEAASHQDLIQPTAICETTEEQAWGPVSCQDILPREPVTKKIAKKRPNWKELFENEGFDEEANLPDSRPTPVKHHPKTRGKRGGSNRSKRRQRSANLGSSAQ